MTLAPEFKIGLIREIFRVQQILNFEIGKYQISKRKRVLDRKAQFSLIELENRLATDSEINISAQVLDFNRAYTRVPLRVPNLQKFMNITEFGKITLTRKEREILQLLPDGLTIAQLAKKLNLSESTVKTHLTSIYRKLNVPNRVLAIAEARRAKLLPSQDF